MTKPKAPDHQPSTAETLLATDTIVHRFTAEGPAGAAPGSAPTPFQPMTTPAPTVLADRFDVQRLLGSGGMGTVYLARDRELEELVALKVLRPELASSEALVERFRREVRTARRITHPNVARVFDIGANGSTRFLTMEFIDGPSVGRVLEKEGAFAVARVLEIAGAVCSGLAAAHQANVIHRDLKPDNILLDKSGRVAITDFGIARPMDMAAANMTVGGVIGTPAYMAPEQVEALADIDHRADLYALGVVLFELLTGALPFVGNSPLAIAAARLTKPPRDPRSIREEIPERLVNVVMRCLERAPVDRYGTVDEVAAALAVLTAPQPRSEAGSILGRGRSLPPVARTLAVLPFDHSDATDALIAEGLCDDLVDALSMIDGLRVRSRAAVASAHPVTDGLGVGKALAVDVVVQGSIRRDRGRLRVTARLLGVSEGFQLWASRYEEGTGDLFALSDTIAQGIAGALGVKNDDRPKRPGVQDTAAVELYLLGKQEHKKMFLGDPHRALVLLEGAVALAPDDPTILAGFALANIRVWFFGEMQSALPAEKAREAATRAVELAPHLADARHALSQYHLHNGEPARAIVELKRVLARSDFGVAHETLASLVLELGLIADGRRHLQIALGVEPTSHFACYELARLAALEGDWPECDHWLERLTSHTKGDEQNLAKRLVARTAFWRGNVEQARALLAVPGRSGPIPGPVLQVISSFDNPDDLERAFASIGELPGSIRRRCILYQLSCEAAGLLDRPEWALKALDGALDSGLIDLLWLERCPVLATVRGARGFERRKAKLALRVDELIDVYRHG